MTGFHYIVIGLCLLLLFWLLVQEVRRQRRSLLAARVGAVVLAVGALAGMVLPLGHYRERVVAVHVAAVGQAPAAIVAVDWRRRLGKGERLRVQGRWGGGKVKMLLTGTGGVLDSAEVTGEFELTTVPAVVGRAVYEIVAVAGKDTLEREEVPVEVRVEKALKILVLASSPDFENTFLINWLGKEGNAVEARVAVSRGKTQLSFVNMEDRESDRLDLVIADSSIVTADLWRQVEEKGLGLLIRVDPSVRIGRPGMRVLERDSLGRAIVGVVLAGAGKVIYSASNTSYSQWLGGRKDDYSAYWTMLLRQAARAGEPEEEWNWRPRLARVGEPVVLELASDIAEPEGLVGGTAVYLEQDAVLSWRWRGRYWPVSAGWQEVRVPGGDTSWAYVWGASKWKGIHRAGGSRTGAKDGAAAEDRSEKRKEWVEFPRWIFYVVFLLSMFFLWVERKMAGMNG
jgi:hypothetical protein